MTATRTPADHIALAKETLTGGADPKYAIAHADPLRLRTHQSAPHRRILPPLRLHAVQSVPV